MAPPCETAPTATPDDLNRLDIRVGRIVDAAPLPEGRYATHRVTVDFGEALGRRVSAARLVRYDPAALVGRLVLGVVNLPPRQIGPVRSECLILGTPDAAGECILIAPDDPDTPLGGRVY